MLTRVNSEPVFCLKKETRKLKRNKLLNERKFPAQISTDVNETEKHFLFAASFSPFDMTEA